MVSPCETLYQLAFTHLGIFPTVIEIDWLRLHQLTEGVEPLYIYEYYAKSETIAEETKYPS